MNLALEVGAYFNVDAITFLGDLLDMYTVSLHPKSPEINRFLDEEIQAGNDFLDLVDREFPQTDKIYIEGNHEFRLSKYLTKNAPDIFGWLRIEDLLEIPSRERYEWVPYGHSQQVQLLGSKLYGRHEPIGTSAKTTATRAMKSIVFGHTHRIESHEVVSIDGEAYRSFSVGCLVDQESRVFNYVRNHHQWSKGFGLMHTDTQTGDWWCDTIRIVDGRCVVNGKLFGG